MVKRVADFLVDHIVATMVGYVLAGVLGFAICALGIIDSGPRIVLLIISGNLLIRVQRIRLPSK